MRQLLMMKGAQILLDTCAAVKASETVLIVTDAEKAGIAQVLAAAAYERKVETILIVIAPRSIDGEEPPAAVAKAMTGADVIFMPVAKSLAHSHATKAALQAGARVLSMTAFTEDQMISGGIEADFVAQRPVCQRLADRFTAARQVRLTSPGGTDLRLSLEGRQGNAHACIVDGPGQFTAVPNIEANIAPVEGSAEGLIVADASIPYLGIGVLREPVRLVVSRGAITEITGGDQAVRIRDILRAQKHPSVYNIAQLAVGLNPMCTEVTGVMLNDEGVFGTVHIGIGTSANIGGVVKAPTHFDLLMHRPTLELDGACVLREGQLVD
jgi:2,5-dihydroxypyridine 5,6-dioxygenase